MTGLVVNCIEAYSTQCFTQDEADLGEELKQRLRQRLGDADAEHLDAPVPAAVDVGSSHGDGAYKYGDGDSVVALEDYGTGKTLKRSRQLDPPFVPVCVGKDRMVINPSAAAVSLHH